MYTPGIRPVLLSSRPYARCRKLIVKVNSRRAKVEVKVEIFFDHFCLFYDLFRFHSGFSKYE